MAGANYMGGKKNAAKVRSRDAAGRQQKRFFGRQRLNLLSKRCSINSPTSRNQPQPSISLAHAKQNSTLSLSPRGYIPSPSKPRKSKRDGPSSASSSSKVLEALDTSERTVLELACTACDSIFRPAMFLRAAMNQILSLPDLAGLSTYKKRKRTSDASSPGARRSKRVKPEPSPEKDEEGLPFGSQNDQLCDSPDASFRDIYHDPEEDEYDDEELDDAFFQGHLGSHTASSSIQSFPILASSQKIPHIPMPNDVAQETSSFGTLAVTSSLQTSFSGNIFDYDDPWTAVGVILGLQSAPSTPAKDVDDTSALAEQPHPSTLARRARLTAYSSDPSSEGIPVASSHSSDNVPPLHVDEDDSYSQSDDFHFGEDESDNDHDFNVQDTHDVLAHVHQNSSPLLLHLSHSPSAYFSSSNDYFNNLAGSPVADEEGKDVDPLFDRNALLDDSNSDCHSQPIIDGEENYADPEDADEYTFFETSSWAILDVDQCVEDSIPDNYSSGFPSPDSLHRQDLITTEQLTGVSPRYRSSPSAPARFNVYKDVLHVAQYASSNASASSSHHSRAHRSPRAFHHSPTDGPLCLLNDTQLAALPITINMPSSDSLARGSQVAEDPEPAVEPTPAPQFTHESFPADKTIHSAHSPELICRDESVEVLAPQSFAGFCLFSRDDFLEEPDSDD